MGEYRSERPGRFGGRNARIIEVNCLPDNLHRDADPLGRALRALVDSGDPFSRHENVVTGTLLGAAIRADTYATDIAGRYVGGITVAGLTAITVCG
jgi:hypothetical protein